ncbi:MAG TPA: LemA family protein [Candidatus Polarisedimenticolaceae bacterium]|nr:LemA family protein [Candidatus Polarisedimenticolaceae bacterium]
MIVLLVLLVLIAAVGFWLIGAYNGLVALRNQVKNAWSQIDVQLKRRHDLIPNLVQTVKGYAAHERQTLESVTAARTRAVQATGVTERAQAEGELSSALGRLMVVVEQYPDLKANQNFLGLQEELTSTENRIGFSRQHYNDSVMRYNTKVQSFPSNFIANAFSFTNETFFELQDAAAREAPQVQF